MKEQNFKNHIRLVAGYHGLTFLCILALLIGSIINLCHSAKENLYSASLICLVAVIFVFMFWYARSFALRAQDRAIRAEENLRYFILTGKALPEQVTLSQIIALRFASNDEFTHLVVRAVNEQLSAKQIKEAIKNWRADYHRV
jgi:hypothetical protein